MPVLLMMKIQQNYKEIRNHHRKKLNKTTSSSMPTVFEVSESENVRPVSIMGETYLCLNKILESESGTE